MVFASRIPGVLALAGMAVCALAASASAVPGYTESGIASWYGKREAGRRTASGAIFDPSQLSAAHRTLPLGSCVRVTRLKNRKSILVPITDRGPFIRGRTLDLSQAAAERLGMMARGLARVRIKTVPCLPPKAAL